MEEEERAAVVELVNAALRLAAVVGTKNLFGFTLSDTQQRAVERTIQAVRPFSPCFRLEAEDVEAALAAGQLEALLAVAPPNPDA